MLPSPERHFIRPAILSLLLVVGMLALSLIPARQALVLIWPGRVAEIVHADGRLSFLQQTDSDFSATAALLRTYPISLWTLELHDGRIIHGFPLAMGQNEEWLLELADGQRQRIDRHDVRRSLRPNAMSWLERVHLLHRRFAERRQVPAASSAEPFSGEGDDLGN